MFPDNALKQMARDKAQEALEAARREGLLRQARAGQASRPGIGPRLAAWLRRAGAQEPAAGSES